ncbi:uncharacterized protein LOC113216116 [Frankliniella occidentalis]|uniref:Uncharacterized protein LOC113216116 n=1 Tax=Frankliniella occidentalis TaxID=133901 RepID=A0A9C6XCG6_FRAOC|nr:uncharacterized protein LOC113216116 [Frankliniella occidentalis]
MYLRPLRDHLDQRVLEKDADDAVVRTRWHLDATPRVPDEDEPADDLAAATWGHGLFLEGQVPLAVTTPDGCKIIEHDPSDPLDILKYKVEESFGIPFELQTVRGSGGRIPVKGAKVAKLFPNIGRLFPRAYVCTEQHRSGPNLWFYVQLVEQSRNHGRPFFLEAKSSDTVASVWRRVRRRLRLNHPEWLYELQQDGAPMEKSRTLQDLGVACLSTLTVAERGCVELTVTVRLSGPAERDPVVVTVRADPSDRGQEVRRRIKAKLKVSKDRRELELLLSPHRQRQRGVVLRRYHLFGLYLDEGRLVDEHAPLAESGLPSRGCAELVLRHRGDIQVPVRTDAGCLLVWTSLDDRVTDVLKKVLDLHPFEGRFYQLRLGGVVLEPEVSLRRAGVDASSVLTHEKCDKLDLRVSSVYYHLGLRFSPFAECSDEYVVSCAPSDTVEELKRVIIEKVLFSGDVEKVKLGHDGKLLANERTLWEYGVRSGSKVHILDCRTVNEYAVGANSWRPSVSELLDDVLGKRKVCSACTRAPCACIWVHKVMDELLVAETESMVVEHEMADIDDILPGLTVGEIVPGFREAGALPTMSVVHFACDQDRSNSDFEFEIFIDEERWRKIGMAASTTAWDQQAADGDHQQVATRWRRDRPSADLHLQAPLPVKIVGFFVIIISSWVESLVKWLSVPVVGRHPCL